MPWGLFGKKKSGGTSDEPQGPQQAPYQSPFPLTGEVAVDPESPDWIYVTPTQADFLTFRSMADTMDGYNLRVAKDDILVWDKKVRGEPMVLIKAFTILEKTKPEDLWDMLHDPEYRIVWDESRLEGYLVSQLTPNCDIGYYAAKAQSPVYNRDFLNQRAWYSAGNGEFVIFNTSVPHSKCPDQKGFVRAISKISGYLIRPYGDGGCCLTYLSNSDPKGWIPTAFVNMLVSKFSPAMLQKIKNAADKYNEWRQQKGDGWKKTWNQESESWPTPQANHTIEFFQERQKKGTEAAPVEDLPDAPAEEQAPPAAEAEQQQS